MDASGGNGQTGGGGDEIAAAFRRHASELYRFCLRLTGDQNQAEEALGEVFLQACKRQEELDFVSRSMRPWLYAVARNVLHNQRREEQRQQAAARGLKELDRRVAEDASEELARRQATEALIGSLGALPKAQRQVIVLCVLDDRSYEAAASDLNVPVGTIRSRLYRARLRLALAVRNADGASNNNTQHEEDTCPPTA
jgi:RNA polymerase sigma-70 factor, ECF subfamily